ncbi:MAG: ribbon-helix-helix protein, CopG family [Actinomycetota bacterium]
MKRKPVLVQFDEELLARLDKLGSEVARSRSAMVRDAVERYVIQESEAEKDRRLIEGYTRIPDTGEFEVDAIEGTRRMIEEEPW